MSEAPLRVGLIGLGVVGQQVVERLWAFEEAITLVGALVQDRRRPRSNLAPPRVTALDELLALDPDVVVEAGGHAALRAHGPGVLRAGVDLLLLSVGALADAAFQAELEAAARAGGGYAQVASGAIGALDVLAAAAVGGLSRVVYTMIQPAAIVLGDDAPALTVPAVLYEGPARAAALRYPERVNVVAAVALAGAGFDRTEVRLVADPTAARFRHEVRAEGRFGQFTFTIENTPTSATVPTSHLVSMSVARALLRYRAPLLIG